MSLRSVSETPVFADGTNIPKQEYKPQKKITTAVTTKTGNIISGGSLGSSPYNSVAEIEAGIASALGSSIFLLGLVGQRFRRRL